MKDLIAKKFEEHTTKILSKDDLTAEDINFLVYMMGRIESQEYAEKQKVESEQRDKEWKEKMYNIIGGI
jgi:hypothetical protein